MSANRSNYEWALFGAMLWSQDARDGVLPTDFLDPAIQPMVRELLDVFAKKIEPAAAVRIKSWLIASKIDISDIATNSSSLKVIVKRLSALAHSMELARAITNGLERNNAGLPIGSELELQQLAERLLERLRDAGH